MATTDSIVSKLPANVEAERSILGAILLDNMAYNEAAENLRPDDFSLDSHRRIYSRMMDLMSRRDRSTSSLWSRNLNASASCRRLETSATSPDC